MKTQSKPELFQSLITHYINNCVKIAIFHSNMSASPYSGDAGDDICSAFSFDVKP